MDDIIIFNGKVVSYVDRCGRQVILKEVLQEIAKGDAKMSKTMGDKIRAMSNQELAEYSLECVNRFSGCTFEEVLGYIETEHRTIKYKKGDRVEIRGLDGIWYRAIVVSQSNYRPRDHEYAVDLLEEEVPDVIFCPESVLRPYNPDQL